MNTRDICPICSEPLDETDLQFFPCPCKFQICLWCYDRLLSEDPRCPSCRAKYKKENEMIAKLDPMLLEKKQTRRLELEKFKKKRINTPDSELKIVNDHLVYVTGMPDYLADRDLLMTEPYFGQYGTIEHCTLQRHKGENFYGIGLYNVYIMYTTKESATDCIQAIDGVYVDDLYLKASYGTTKYCKYFLSNRECHSSNCLYYHQKAPDNMCFIKEETSGYNPEFYEASHPPKIPNRRNIYFDSTRFPQPKWYLHKNSSSNNNRSNNNKNYYYQRSYSSTPPSTSTPKSDIDSGYTTPTTTTTTSNNNDDVGNSKDKEIKYDNSEEEEEEDDDDDVTTATTTATTTGIIMAMDISSIDHSNYNSTGSEIISNNNTTENRQSSSIDTQNSANTDDIIQDDEIIQQQQQQQYYNDPSFIPMYQPQPIQQQQIPIQYQQIPAATSIPIPPPGFIQSPQQLPQQQQNMSLLQMLMSNQPKTKYVPPPPGFDEAYLEQHNHNNTANKDLLRSLFPNANITYHPYANGNK